MKHSISVLFLPWSRINSVFESIAGKALLIFSSANMVFSINVLADRFGFSQVAAVEKVAASSIILISYVVATIFCPSILIGIRGPQDYFTNIFKAMDQTSQSNIVAELQKQKILGAGPLETHSELAVSTIQFRNLDSSLLIARGCVTALLLLAILTWLFRDIVATLKIMHILTA